MGSQLSNIRSSSSQQEQLEAATTTTEEINNSSSSLSSSSSSSQQQGRRKRKYDETVETSNSNDDHEEEDAEDENDEDDNRNGGHDSDNANRQQQQQQQQEEAETAGDDIDGQQQRIRPVRKRRSIIHRRRKKKKRRRVVPSSTIANIWESINEIAAKWFAKFFFLNIVEMATNRAKDGELLDERDIISGIETMLDYFQSKDIDMLRRGWRALFFCCCSMRPQLPERENVFEDDVACVCHVMDKCSSRERIQLLGCRALRVLIEESKDDWNALYKGGALPVLVKSMRNFPDKKIVQGLTITFIVMFLKEIDEPAKADLLQLNGVPLILQAMRKFENDEALIHTGCCAMYQLCGRSMRGNLIRHGAINDLLGAIERFTEVESIVQLSLATLNKLSLDANFSGIPIIPLMLRVMTEYHDDDTVQFYCLVLVRAAGRAGPLPIESIIPATLAAMREFPDSGGILFFGCAVMYQILIRHDNGQRDALNLITSSGGLECVISAARRHNGVSGLAPVAHLILLHAWENRPTDRENVAATQAFGGTEQIIPLISGLDVGGMMNRAARNNNDDDDDDDSDDDE